MHSRHPFLGPRACSDQRRCKRVSQEDALRPPGPVQVMSQALVRPRLSRASVTNGGYYNLLQTRTREIIRPSIWSPNAKVRLGSKDPHVKQSKKEVATEFCYSVSRCKRAMHAPLAKRLVMRQDPTTQSRQGGVFAATCPAVIYIESL